MSRVALTHVIEERFATPVTLATHWLRLRPAAHARAGVTAYSLRVRTEPHFVNWFRDAYENHVARLDFPEPVTRLAIDVDVVAEIADANPFDFLLDDDALEHPFAYGEQARRDLAPYLQLERPGPRLARWLPSLPRGRTAVIDRVRETVLAVHEAVALDPVGARDLETALALRAGTAEALAWLAVASLRALGIAARFASGYRVHVADGAANAALHAWTEAFLPGAGWVGIDPTCGLFTTDAWIPLACAPEPATARTIAGFREACDGTDAASLVARVLEPSPAPSPYSAADWAEIAAVGRAVDADLAAAGVRLGLARELAFTSTRHSGAPEWRTTALGESKVATAEALASALRARLVPDAVVTRGDGEWFAGEASPRWRVACVWRADGRPLWRGPAWPASSPSALPPDAAATFARALADTLGVPAASVIAAYEDPLAGARADRDGFDAPLAGELGDPERRRALADRLSAERAGAPVGWVLPLAWDYGAEAWRSGAWRFRRGRLHLLPGSFAMGVRLPLASLPPDDAAESRDPARDPLAPREPLPDGLASLGVPPPSDEPPPRTAVCLEVRDDRLHAFLPPLGRAEAWVRLVAAIDDVAARTGVGVVVEGYEAPEDDRLPRLVIEPAPGTLRMILPTTGRMDDHAALLDAAYDEAARLGLRTERLAADGAVDPLPATALLVVGGTTADVSPFFDRPELLRALIVYWQRHPSLSYLFRPSALVGPGGPAPRADESRVDALGELAIALERLAGGDRPPWWPDRVLRHLLADASGDCRRTELDTERLFDPTHAARRRGELSIKSFGVAPCARTAAVQSLLVAAIVARLARAGGDATTTPWGPALHDRFMLPSVLRADLDAVLTDLARSGRPLQPVWFAPFVEAQFPLLGRVQLGDVALELRPAHEPWPVLAEEATGAGMARFVDSANGRLEARLTGASPRHVLACNGRRVPLRPGGDDGTLVAGVRYKRWNPTATLHPTAPPTGELVFDVVDVWTDRAIGGCRYTPAVPELAGIVGAPWIDETPMPGERHVRPPFWPLPPVSARGSFRAGGSGVGPMAPPAFAAGDEWTLDLTGVA
jgi:uncharacterized protein (DUF2126 family)/transglutaminase-like putative cysteine protease